MIVIINPSSKAGHSFKGLHQYCSHDQDRAQTSERVDWMDTRNVAAEDPNQAWKIMASTAYSQNQLKQNAGIRTGQAPKDGAVMHVVLSFDKDEPRDPDNMRAAADEFLSRLGADPAKMRAKNKPKSRQFADEHQTVMYAHSDTDNHHLHLMINRIHPQNGRVLPTNNDHSKAQAWALDYSKRHGTDQKTPARQENKEMRNNGEYVKGSKRKTRNAYELEQKHRAASNDNNRLKAVMAEQRKKDSILAELGRTTAKQHAKGWNELIQAHRGRKSDLSRQLQTQINKAKAAAREEFRPKMRELRKQQEAQRKTFDGLEGSFFGRAANAFKTVVASAVDIGGHKRGFNVKTFQAATGAGGRKQLFDEAQERARKAVEREQSLTAQRATERLKTACASKLAENRAYLISERTALKERHAENAVRLKSDWKKRNQEREHALAAVPVPVVREKTFKDKVKIAHARKEYRTEFDAARQPVPEQNNSKNKSSGDAGDDGRIVSPPPVSKTPEPLKKSYAETQRENAAKAKERRKNKNRDDKSR